MGQQPHHIGCHRPKTDQGITVAPGPERRSHLGHAGPAQFSGFHPGQVHRRQFGQNLRRLVPIGGDARKLRRFSEYWTFIRSASAKPGVAAQQGRCPNCGAPIAAV